MWFLKKGETEKKKMLTDSNRCNILTKPTNKVKKKSTMEGGDAV